MTKTIVIDGKRVKCRQLRTNEIIKLGDIATFFGKSPGFADARGTLFFELAKIIEAKQPQAFVLGGAGKQRNG
jgi:hypothetical protein